MIVNYYFSKKYDKIYKFGFLNLNMKYKIQEMRYEPISPGTAGIAQRISSGYEGKSLNEVVEETSKLVFLMKNELIQSLLKRGCSGTILTAISKEELKRIPLEDIDRGE